jgi:hypothetical protein
MTDEKHLPVGDGGTKAKAEAITAKRTKIVFMVLKVRKELCKILSAWVCSENVSIIESESVIAKKIPMAHHGRMSSMCVLDVQFYAT